MYSAYLRVGVLVCQSLEKLIYPSQGVCASVLCLYVWLCLKICLCPCICPYVSVCAFKCVWVCACTARSYVFSLYWCLCLWQQSVRTHICWWRGCWRTLLCMWLFFSMLSLCEFACVYVHTCVYHTCLLSLCLCECVHTHVCVARMLGTFLRRWEKRGFQCSRLLFHSSSIASLLLAPHAILQTQTQTNIYIMHICNDINTHTHKSKLADFPAMSFYIFHWYSSWNKNPNNTSQLGSAINWAQTRCV